MKTNYRDRLCIYIDGDDVTEFTTQCGEQIAKGYSRIVIGKRGPYVEFDEKHLIADSLCSCSEEHYYYVELRTTLDRVKIYAQAKRVNYADYIPGKFYISPFDLYVDSLPIIVPLKRKTIVTS